jgi:hypothetical protein
MVDNKKGRALSLRCTSALKPQHGVGHPRQIGWGIRAIGIGGIKRVVEGRLLQLGGWREAKTLTVTNVFETVVRYY